MKNLLTFVLFLLITSNCLSQSHGNVQIGIVSGETWTITMNENLMSTRWSIFLGNNGINILFTQFEIVKNQEGKYILIGTNMDNSIKAGIALVEDDGILYEALSVTGGGTTCVCTGCSVGCNPDELVTGWVCVPFCSTPMCTKSVTATSSIGILEEN